jgi:hypothetical protein
MPSVEGLIFLNEIFGFDLMSKIRLRSYFVTHCPKMKKNEEMAKIVSYNKPALAALGSGIMTGSSFLHSFSF